MSLASRESCLAAGLPLACPRRTLRGPASSATDDDTTDEQRNGKDARRGSAATLTRVRDVVTSRWFVKGAFLALFVWSCIQLFRFAAWARGEGPYVARPEAPAGILPIGHFTSFFGWVRGGGWDTLLPAGLVIILGRARRSRCCSSAPSAAGSARWDGLGGFAAGGRKLLGGRNLRLAEVARHPASRLSLPACRGVRGRAAVRRPRRRGGRIQAAARTCGSPT